ncbi:MAG: hypothetical protein JSW41_03910 [Candidatus Aenigmatarchaeota archaeon]|nr:MAG: hypothetical protein JSW41_03910 [Candidatus Aenigmarchaeota archaeon]
MITIEKKTSEEKPSREVVEEKTSQEIPPFEVVKGDRFSSFSVHDVSGGMHPNGCVLAFFLHRQIMKPDKENPGRIKLAKIEQSNECEIHLTPALWKSIVEWMSQSLQSYEGMYGEIPRIPKAYQQKTGEKPPTTPGMYG